MGRQSLFGIAAVLAIVGSGWALAFARGQQQPQTRADFMRQKLDFSRDLLDGLTREDYAQIIKNAKSLKAMSEAAIWSDPVLKIRSRYQWFSLEFQDLTDEIVARAEEKNLEGATLGYVQLVANCMRCHRHVKDGRN